MDKFQLWLYVLIGIGYALSRLLKKPAEKPSSQPQTRPKPASQQSSQPQSGGPQKALTFEELLREITASKEPQQVPPQRRPAPAYAEEVVIGEEEAQDLEDVNYDYRKYNKTYETYEQAKKQAFARPSLEETMKIEDTVVNFGKFKEFELKKEKNLMEQYLGDFKDPEGLKKAMVISEVLQRKF